MADYKCFECNKDISPNLLRKRVRCPFCGSKTLFKPRTATVTLKAR